MFAIIYEKDGDFGEADAVEIPPVLENGRQKKLLPSPKIDHLTLLHLSRRQKQELLDLLDRYSWIDILNASRTLLDCVHW
jgi:hypothetical protein